MKNVRRIIYFARDMFRYHVLSLRRPLGPSYVLISLTYKCNSRCTMCNIWKIHPKNELTYDEWSGIMKDPIFKGIERLDITGGEALMLPNAVDLISLFIASMPKLRKLSLVSNGFTTDRIIAQVAQIARICKKRHIQCAVSISLDGVGKTHDEIRRVKNGFSLASATLLRLKRMEKTHNILVSSGSVVMKQNVAKAEEMRRWYAAHNIPYGFQIVGFHNTYLQNTDTRNSVDFTQNQQEELEKFLLQESRPKSWKDIQSYYWRDLLAMYRDKQRRTTPCPFLKDYFALDSYGSVYYCFSSPSIGNCRESHDVSGIYFNKTNTERRKRMWQTVCSRCNSGCRVDHAIMLDGKKYFWFRLTGKPWQGFREFLPRLMG
jgi:MoaA/NifB/PqqE/SkfB family radical SAM enzyme